MSTSGTFKKLDRNPEASSEVVEEISITLEKEGFLGKKNLLICEYLQDKYGENEYL